MYKIKLYKNLLWWNSIILRYYFLKNFPVLLFFDIFFFTNQTLLKFKMKLELLNIKSYILTTKFLNKIVVKNHFYFFKTKILVVGCLNLNDCFLLLPECNFFPFYYSYLKSFSLINSMQNFFNIKINYKNNNFIWGLIVFKIIIYLIILLVYLLYTLIKLLIC